MKITGREPWYPVPESSGYELATGIPIRLAMADGKLNAMLTNATAGSLVTSNNLDLPDLLARAALGWADALIKAYNESEEAK